MTGERWSLVCPECSRTLITAELKESEFITSLSAICPTCLKVAKYSKGTMKVDELKLMPRGQKKLDQ